MTIFACQILDHFFPLVIWEVNINIWQVMTVYVNETLEDQIIFDWINFCNPHQVANQTTSGRTTCWANQHCFLSMLDQVCYYEKVVSVILLLNQIHLTLQACCINFIPISNLTEVKELLKVVSSLPMNHSSLW